MATNALWTLILGWIVSVIAGRTYPRRQLFNFTGSSSRHNWLSMKEVGSLQNDEVVVMVASTGSKGSSYIRDRIVPSSRTWMRFMKNVYVVLEDTPDLRFQFRHCDIQEMDTFVTFTCPHEPTYVLTSVCTERYYRADGICCKIDESINFLVKARPLLFDKFKYLLQCDDDTFWRIEKTMQWLSYLNDHKIHELPVIGNAVKTPRKKEDEVKGVWHIDGCTDIVTLGWYQPVMLTRTAVLKLVAAAKAFGFTKTCTNFDVSQDVGIGIMAWLQQFFHIQIPGVQMNPDHTGIGYLKNESMVVHSVRAITEDDCAGQRWPKDLRRNQHTVIGCGTLENAVPNHDKLRSMNMYDVYNYFQQNGTEVNYFEDWTNGKPTLVQLSGYNQTLHSQKHDVSTHWTDFHLDDCRIPGKKIPK